MVKVMITILGNDNEIREGCLDQQDDTATELQGNDDNNTILG